MKKQHSNNIDSMLMRLCKIKARSKGYYSDEPQYKSYCTKLYNATKEGKGIAGLAGDANNEATAERLTKLFKAIGFPYRVEASGKFLDFYDLNPDAEDPILFDDDAEDVFYDQFGKVVNFKVLISQFYDRDEKVKAYVEKNLSSKRQAKKTEPKIEREEEVVEAEEKVEIPKSKPVSKTAKSKVEKEDVDVPDIEQDEDSSEPIVEETAKSSKGSSSKSGVLGGLKYDVLSANQFLTEYKRVTKDYPSPKDRLLKMGSLRIQGSKLIRAFGKGLPDYYGSDEQYILWCLKIDELGFVIITNRDPYTSDEEESANVWYSENLNWSVKLMLEPLHSINEKQCDHTSHFFGDTFFDKGFKITSSACSPNDTTNAAQLSYDVVKSGSWTDGNTTYTWEVLTQETALQFPRMFGGYRGSVNIASNDNGLSSWADLKIFLDPAEAHELANNSQYMIVTYPIVLKVKNAKGIDAHPYPSLYTFSYRYTNDKLDEQFYVTAYRFTDTHKKSLDTSPDQDRYEYIENNCDALKSFIKYAQLDLKTTRICTRRKKWNGMSDCSSCDETSLSDDKSFDELIEQLIEEHDIDLDVYDYDDYIIISRIVVPKNKRNEGIGTEVIEKILEYADDNDKDVFVTPTSDFGGSMTRLTKFYKSFGFVPNKGKYRDFRTRETMIRKNSTLDDHSDDMPTLFSSSNNVDLGKLENDDRHKAPYRDDEGFFSPAHDVSKAFPGIYSMSFSKALREYGTGNDSDPMAVQIIRNIQDNPDAKVKIYRAVEKGLQDNIADLKQDRKYINRNGSVPPWADVPPHSAEEYSAFVDSQIDNLGSVEGATIQPSINPNEWVTITRQYAVDHGECCVPGGYTILTKTVKAKDLFTEGNSIHEWGYDPGNDTGLRDQSFMPPKEVQEEAERGLEWRREYNRGGTSVGVARARDLSNGKSVSYDTVKRMKAYFDRHSVDKDVQGFRQGEPGYPSAGRIAWSLWGGDAGYRWSKSIVSKQGLGELDANDQLSGKVLDTQEKEQSKEVAPLTTQEVINMDPPQTLPLKGEMRDFLSNLLAKFNMLIWGGAGSGKSSFVLRLANELAETNTGRVLYYMTEEKVSSGRLKARMDLMKAYSDNVNFDDHGTFDRLTALVNTGMYRYVIVDSINMINVEQQRIVDLMQTFPEVSWIFIAQATKGKNAYAGIQSLAHAVDTEISTANDKGTAVAELKKHRDGALKTHTIFGSTGMRDPGWQAQW